MKGIQNSLGATELLFYRRLFFASYTDVASASAATDIEIERDKAYIASRLDAEGVSFLTKTLPKLGKAVDLALSSGTSLLCPGLSKAKGSQLPKLMGWLFKEVFDESGSERSDASEPSALVKRGAALGYLRQLLFMFYKLELPYTSDQEMKVINTFIETDRATHFDFEKLDSVDRNALRIAKHLIHTVLTEECDVEGVIPRHGPGAVATGEKCHEKMRFKRYYRALDQVFPYPEYFFYNANHFSDCCKDFYTWDALEAGTAKVVLVPKDSRGPRLISCEPLEYQWIQQGLMSKIVKIIEHHPLTRGRINFRDQTINRRMALSGSKSGRWVTLDMKEASDRVLTSHIEYLFPEMWKRTLLACRTTATTLPDVTVIRLRKFAPMGSAICFPVEALIFWALTAAAIKNTNIGLTSLERVARSVFVFGDDIVVRKQDHLPTMQLLPKVGLLFNEGKCCTSGFFRESCGCDAYHGIDVTPLKIKRRWCHHLTGTSHVSWCEYHNSLAERGYFEAASFVAEEIQRARVTPWANYPGSACPCLIDPRKNAVQENKRLNLKTRFENPKRDKPNYQVYEVYAWTARPVTYVTGAPGWGEMLRVASHKVQTEELMLQTNYLQYLYDRDSDLAPARHKLLYQESLGDMVAAYQYTVRRRVTQKRRWARVIL